MTVLIAVQILAALSTGLKAGVLFGDQMAARFARPGLSPSSFVKYQQVQIARWERFMPAFAGATVISGIAWLGLAWDSIGSIGFMLVALATTASIASMVFALTRCWPINKQLMTWSITSPPPDVMKIWARWDQTNAIRSFLAVTAFVCVVSALVASSGATS
jgi:hypothetical protein